MHEYAGNAHIHTPFSDGAKWHAEIAQAAIAANLDFIIITDHNIWVKDIEGYYDNGKGRVLLLSGEEVHDMRRQPQANHFLAYGAERELTPFACDPQRLIDETRATGGCGFLAHPFDPAAPSFGEQALGWVDWDIEGYNGLEIWNYMSNFKSLLNGKLNAVRAALNPAKYVLGPLPETLAMWDGLLVQGKRVAAVGNSDAHGQTYKMGPLSRVIFPYEYLFKAVNTHILTAEALTGELCHDKQIVLKALSHGNSWVGYDLPHNTRGFRFSGQSRTRGVMGDEIKLDAGATLQVMAPTRCHIRLIWNGKIISEVENKLNLTYYPTDAGAYRAECYISYLGKDRGWIFSNPIYLV